MSTTTYTNKSWGILGNPSPEKIEEYKNMPVGAFREMIKALNKKNKGKPLMPFEVFVEKKIVNSHLGSVVASAANWQQAFDVAKERLEEVEFTLVQNRQGRCEYSYHSYDPRRYWDKE
jgi:hypothetical protein